MSSGQRPRTHLFFPDMKRRSRKRTRGKGGVTIYGSNWKPVWPQVLNLRDGTSVPVKLTDLRINGRSYDVDTRTWMDAP